MSARREVEENLTRMEPEIPAWPQSPGEERELVDRMRAGEESAFEVFAGSYVPALYRFARRRLDDDRELAQEIVQTTVCKVIQKLDGYRGDAAFFTWLCACCRNEIAAHYRKLQRRPREVALHENLRDNEPIDSSPGIEDRLGGIETAERVHLALDRLPPGYARAMEWRYLENLDVSDIARRLGTGYKAAESLLSRAREAFRRSYESLLDTGESAAGPPGRV